MRRLNFNWVRHGVVFDAEKRFFTQGIKYFTQAPNCILLNDRIRCFYSTRDKTEDGRYLSNSYYFDLHKDYPHHLIDYDYTSCLKLGLPGSFDEFGIYPFSIIKNNNGYVAAYGGWTRPKTVPFEVSIGLALSSDCVKFEKIGVGPSLTKSLNEPFIIASPKIKYFEENYYLFYIAGENWSYLNGKYEPIYKIRLATSTDLMNWNRIDKDLIPDILGDQECQAAPEVFKFGGLYYMIFSYRNSIDYMNNPNNSYRLGLATSSNLVTWIRDDTNLNFGLGLNGWDSISVSYASVVISEENILMFYTGNGIGRTGIGLAISKISYD